MQVDGLLVATRICSRNLMNSKLPVQLPFAKERTPFSHYVKQSAES